MLFSQEDGDRLLFAATRAATITPSDTTNVASVTKRGLLVLSNGGVHVRMLDGNGTTVDLNLGNWSQGQVIPLNCTRVLAATLATVVGLY